MMGCLVICQFRNPHSLRTENHVGGKLQQLARSRAGQQLQIDQIPNEGCDPLSNGFEVLRGNRMSQRVIRSRSPSRQQRSHSTESLKNLGGDQLVLNPKPKDAADSSHRLVDVLSGPAPADHQLPDSLQRQRSKIADGGDPM